MVIFEFQFWAVPCVISGLLAILGYVMCQKAINEIRDIGFFSSALACLLVPATWCFISFEILIALVFVNGYGL